MVRDLNVLVRVSKAVNSVRGLEALEKQVLESILEVAPAGRSLLALVMLAEADQQPAQQLERGPRPAVLANSAELRERVCVGRTSGRAERGAVS